MTLFFTTILDFQKNEKESTLPLASPTMDTLMFV